MQKICIYNIYENVYVYIHLYKVLVLLFVFWVIKNINLYVLAYDNHRIFKEY